MYDPRFTGVKYAISDKVVELEERVTILENIVSRLVANHHGENGVTLH